MYHNPKLRNITRSCTDDHVSTGVEPCPQAKLQCATEAALDELMIAEALNSASTYQRLVTRWRQHLIDTSSRRVARWIEHGGL